MATFHNNVCIFNHRKSEGYPVRSVYIMYDHAKHYSVYSNSGIEVRSIKLNIKIRKNNKIRKWEKIYDLRTQ